MGIVLWTACGQAVAIRGTQYIVATNTGDDRLASKARLLTTVGYRVHGKTTFALEGSIFSAGAAIKWLRDRLGLIGDLAEASAARQRQARFVPKISSAQREEWLVGWRRAVRRALA